ncbi:glucose-6-phosphate dehydrogenase [Buchnera aphidicola]|uniref:glucose-6-phosphate dehydrogenase n=1 Tax=Buchnera aphidicola TaxID=9 RepID=UPI0031B875EA
MKKFFLQQYDLILFGAKGDLSGRKLIPALYELEKKSLLHKNTRIIGVGRAHWSNEKYIEYTFNTLKNFCINPIDMQIWKKFQSKLLFCNLDVTNISHFYTLKKVLIQNNNTKIYYFAVPPHTFGNICKGIGEIKLHYYPNRIVVEKPIGTSFKSSQKINNQLNLYFQENQIFRIDHYLGKETVLNLLILRFSNPIFYYQWNHNYIKYIKIFVSEKIGIEGRWKYFNSIGQTRDMVQNHLLQILSLLTMSIPKSLDATNIQSEKIKLLKSLRKINLKTINTNTIRGQYNSGIIDNQCVPSYTKELFSEINSQTETFVAIKTFIDNETWKNVPIYLKTGKRMFEKTSKIVICFKQLPYNLFQNYKHQNKLIIQLQPNEGITIQFFNKNPEISSKYNTKKSNLYFNYCDILKENIPDAYERLFLEIMNNDQSLFISKKEIEISWKWIDSIIQSWKINNTPLILYKSGIKDIKFNDEYDV